MGGCACSTRSDGPRRIDLMPQRKNEDVGEGKGPLSKLIKRNWPWVSYDDKDPNIEELQFPDL